MRVRVNVAGICRGGGQVRGLGAGEFDGGAGAVIERQDEAALVRVERDDGADESDPFDRVVEVEVEVLACAKERRRALMWGFD